MPGVAFDIHLGSWTASSDVQKSSAPLLQLTCDLMMGGAGGRCVVELGVAALAPPAAGDLVTVSLDAGQGAAQVFSGQVQEVRVGPSSLRISAVDGLALLARAYIEATYEQVSAGFIAKELLSKAGLTPGKIDDGPTFPS